jgi:hypothetical protein
VNEDKTRRVDLTQGESSDFSAVSSVGFAVGETDRCRLAHPEETAAALLRTVEPCFRRHRSRPISEVGCRSTRFCGTGRSTWRSAIRAGASRTSDTGFKQSAPWSWGPVRSQPAADSPRSLAIAEFPPNFRPDGIFAIAPSSGERSQDRSATDEAFRLTGTGVHDHRNPGSSWPESAFMMTESVFTVHRIRCPGADRNGHSRSARLRTGASSRARLIITGRCLSGSLNLWYLDARGNVTPERSPLRQRGRRCRSNHA